MRFPEGIKIGDSMPWNDTDALGQDSTCVRVHESVTSVHL